MMDLENEPAWKKPKSFRLCVALIELKLICIQSSHEKKKVINRSSILTEMIAPGLHHDVCGFVTTGQ